MNKRGGYQKSSFLSFVQPLYMGLITNTKGTLKKLTVSIPLGTLLAISSPIEKQPLKKTSDFTPFTVLVSDCTVVRIYFQGKMFFGSI